LFGKISPFYANKRILVTGASGYLATNLIRWLKEINCIVIRMSRSGRLSSIKGHANIVDVTGDICTRETCRNKAVHPT
jgi:nucleoside-diphosphate-sugar epimerase